MNKREFETLRKLEGKRIEGDVQLRPDPSGGRVMRAKDVIVHNEIGWPVAVDIHYDPRFPKLVVNFSVDGVGPICRVCVNGTAHKTVGRHHKHTLRAESDPSQNLPHAVTRPDYSTLPLEQVWNLICREANIAHNGVLHGLSN